MSRKLNGKYSNFAYFRHFDNLGQCPCFFTDMSESKEKIVEQLGLNPHLVEVRFCHLELTQKAANVMTVPRQEKVKWCKQWSQFLKWPRFRSTISRCKAERRDFLVKVQNRLPYFLGLSKTKIGGNGLLTPTDFSSRSR